MEKDNGVVFVVGCCGLGTWRTTAVGRSGVITAFTASTASIAPTPSTDSNLLLPDGWIEHKTGEGQLYYEHRESNTVQWEKPSTPSLSSTAPATADTSKPPQHHTRDSTKLPPDWNKHNDEGGRRYYSNNSTQESSWVAPEGATGGSASARDESVSSYSNPMKRTKAK